MSNRDPLSKNQIDDALQALTGWSFEGDQLRKTFNFGDFREAVAFIVRVAFEAEEMNHHPELHNVYDTVTVALSTHDAGNKVTELDTNLARRIDAAGQV
ncbi:hypothetical protein BH23BAC4_BH23BAC4_10920 [soil metagenome]